MRRIILLPALFLSVSLLGVYRSSEDGIVSKTLSDLCLEVEVKREINHIIELLQKPRKHYHAHALLLHGPSGVGKTTLARIVARETGCELFEESASNFVNSYQGSGPETVRNLFQEARDADRPVIVFIDEIEAIASVDTKYNSSREYENALKTLWIELDRCKQFSGNVFVIVATNAYEKLDVRIRRRFIKNTIAIGTPTRAERKKIIQYHAQACDKELSAYLCNFLSYVTWTWSGSDLQLMIEKAAEKIGDERVIAKGVLYEAFKKVRKNKKDGDRADAFINWEKTKIFSTRLAETALAGFFARELELTVITIRDKYFGPSSFSL